MKPDARNPEPSLMRRAHPVRDNIEGILTVVFLILTIRYFVFEVFVIPTGSMSPTLMGQHRDLICDNCKLPFAVDSGDGQTGAPKVVDAVCPNCGYEVPEETVRSTWSRAFPTWPRRFFWRGSNRVIVNKFLSRYSAPHRWDVIVFRFPAKTIVCKDCGAVTQNVPIEHEDRCPDCHSTHVRVERKNYIKRLIGLPGDTMEIRHGDIYVNGQLARKPRNVQDEVWQLVMDSAHVPEREFGDVGPRWKPESGTVREDKKTGVLELVPEDGAPARVRYGRPIKDFIAYNGNQNDTGECVGDLRWTTRVRMGEPGTLRFDFVEDDQDYSGTLRFGDGPGRTAISASTRTLAEADYVCSTGVDHSIQFSNVDDRLELWVDGKCVLAVDAPVALENVPRFCWESGAAIQVSGGKAILEHIRLERDLNYRQNPNEGWYFTDASDTHVYQVPENHYFVLGDNARNSLDGRYWGYLPAENLLGKAVVIWWPLERMRIVR